MELYFLILRIFNDKNFFWPILSISFIKNIFAFWCSYTISNFKFEIFFIKIFILFSIKIRCNINWCLWTMLLYLLTILSKQTFFEIAAMCLNILFYGVLINLHATTDFPSLHVEYVSILSVFRNLLKRLL